MTRGVARLQAAASGFGGAKLVWMLENVEPSEDDFSGEPPIDTLVSGDHRGAFFAWRCTRCKVVSFTYPQGSKHA